MSHTEPTTDENYHGVGRLSNPRLNCQSNGGSDYCAHCGRDMVVRDDPRCSFLLKSIPAHWVAAFGCDAEAEGAGGPCKTWCGKRECAVSLKKPQTATPRCDAPGCNCAAWLAVGCAWKQDEPATPCPECGATMAHDEGEPWGAPSMGCAVCGHKQPVKP